MSRAQIDIAVTIALSLAFSSAAMGQTQTGTTFVEPYRIYSIDIPPGWTQVADQPGITRFTAPGGTENGTIFLAMKPATRSLDEEITSNLGGDPFAYKEREKRTLHGMSCEYASLNSGVEALICEFTVPYSDGPKKMNFVMGGSASSANADEQRIKFAFAMASILWAKGITP